MDVSGVFSAALSVAMVSLLQPATVSELLGFMGVKQPEQLCECTRLIVFVLLALVPAILLDVAQFHRQKRSLISKYAAAQKSSEDEEAPEGVSVVIPTYCEEGNLKELCTRVHKSLSDANIAHEIIVVDDNSPDNSVDVIRKLADEDKVPVRIIVRKNERGLSSAVMRGFAESKYSVLQCMDADLSHPPETLPAMFTAIQSGRHEFVLGSRYIAGGRSEHTMLRYVISKGATLLARPLVPVLSDPMSGFFAMPRHAVRRATRVNATGFKIGLELNVRARVPASRCTEVPIVFKDRVYGESKLAGKVYTQYLSQLAKLYVSTYPGTLAAGVTVVARLAALLLAELQH
ncbi:MAG: hypothetical protein MHM6MM_000560 [Cercozoa sp. M6MM]